MAGVTEAAHPVQPQCLKLATRAWAPITSGRCSRPRPSSPRGVRDEHQPYIMRQQELVNGEVTVNFRFTGILWGWTRWLRAVRDHGARPGPQSRNPCSRAVGQPGQSRAGEPLTAAKGRPRQVAPVTTGVLALFRAWVPAAHGAAANDPGPGPGTSPAREVVLGRGGQQQPQADTGGSKKIQQAKVVHNNQPPPTHTHNHGGRCWAP